MTDLPYEDLVWACTNLCDLIEVENEALARHDIQTVQDLADNKAALARIYEQSVLPMSEDPGLVESLDPEQREELTELGRRLQDLVEANARALQANMAAAEMVMDAVVRVARESSTDTTVYSATGTFRQRRGTEGASLSFNDEL